MRHKRTEEERQLARQLSIIDQEIHAPRGFTDRVMNAVYRETLAPRSVIAASRERERAVAAEGARQAAAVRLYRRIAMSLMLTAAVLAVSLLVPRAAYPTLIGPGEGAALGPAPTDAVRSALAGAATTVQGALGEQSIGGSQQ